MTTETYVARIVLPAALELLPSTMATPAACAQLIAIGRQESDGFRARRQYQGGPARGFWQFEQGGGVAGVLRHERTSDLAKRLCRLLCVEPSPPAVWAALEHHDILAAVFARLLLYTDPRRLPAADAPIDGWLIYLATWRPGKPHEATWRGNFAAGWALPWPGQVRA